MKILINSILLILLIANFSNAQDLNELASKNIADAIPTVKLMAGSSISNKIDLVGLGDVAEFSKETKAVLSSFAAYLVSNKEFRRILVASDNWRLRPINEYLNNRQTANEVTLDSLMNAIFLYDHRFHNAEFRSFLAWLKNYNFNHKDDQVTIYGVSPITMIPVSYFLSNYIYTIDEEYGKKFSEKWASENTSDAAAYLDIHSWMEEKKKQKLSSQEIELLSNCESDLEHNSFVISTKSVTDKFPSKILIDRYRYIAHQVLKSKSQKSIFYATNTDVVTSSISFSQSVEQQPLNSIGSFLKQELNDKYFVITSDFSVSASLPSINLADETMLVKNITSKLATDAVKKKKTGYITRVAEPIFFKGLQVRFLYPFEVVEAKSVPQIDEYSVDALLLFTTLSKIDFKS